MSEVHLLDRVHHAFVPPTSGGMPAQIACPPGAPGLGESSAAGAAATLVKLAFANLIGLAFVLVLPFAGIAALSWFAARAMRGSTAPAATRRARS